MNFREEHDTMGKDKLQDWMDAPLYVGEDHRRGLEL